MAGSINHLYKFDRFIVDAFSRRLLRHEEPVALTSRAFDLLLVLMQNSGRLMGKDELMDAVWQDAAVEEANLAVNISQLRKALGEVPNQHRHIITVPGRGYKFLAEVTHSAEEPTEIVLHEHIRATIIEEEFEEENPLAGVSQQQRIVETTSATRRAPRRLAFAVAVLLLIGAISGFVAFRGANVAKLKRLPMRVVPYTSLQGYELEPSFSPDGKQIAFVCAVEDPLSATNGVYVKLLNSETSLKITSKPGEYDSPK